VSFAVVRYGFVSGDGSLWYKSHGMRPEATAKACQGM